MRIPSLMEIQLNKDPDLDEMINRLDKTPILEIEFNTKDHFRIFNWLQELQLYRKLCGPLNQQNTKQEELCIPIQKTVTGMS